MNTYAPIKNPSFVGREYTQDDEVVEYELNGFHYLSPTESLKLEDYFASLEETDEERDEDEDGDDCVGTYDGCDYEDYDYEHSTLARVTEAVQDALDLQEFFARQKTTEKAVIIPVIIKESKDDEPKVDVIEKAVSIRRSYISSGRNRKSRLRKNYRRVEKQCASWEDKELPNGQTISVPCMRTYIENKFVSQYWTQAQRCHGGTDNRRCRRDDETGKIIGHNHRRRFHDYDTSRKELRPIAINLYDADGIPRRIRVS